MMTRVHFRALLLLLFLLRWAPAEDSQLPPRLPNGLTLDPAGRTFDVGNMPLSAATAPNGLLVLSLSGFREQGIQVVDPATGSAQPAITQPSAFVGLAFSSDGKTLYASGAGENVIFAYAWNDGKPALLKKYGLNQGQPGKVPSRTPAGIALSADNRFLYIAENMSDTFAVLDLGSGGIADRRPAGHYPYGVVVGVDGRAYVSAWGGNVITRFQIDARTGKVRDSRQLPVGRHPSALLLNKKGTRLFVACASVDSISIVDTRKFKVISTLTDSAPGTREGSSPNALALSQDQKQLYVAEADNNAVAVFQLSAASSDASPAAKKDLLLGRIPVGWYPTAFAWVQDKLYVMNGKGRGTRANPNASHGRAYVNTPTDYALGQLNGTITELPLNLSGERMAAHTKRVAVLNHWDAPPEKNAYPPFQHVMYIIKENRTYDQVFGDLSEGDGDPSLLFFPESASPNHRAIVKRFGLFDRFFVNAEVSSQGHPWSMSAYVTDFTEKTVHSTYSDRREGEALDDEVSEPSTGYLWDLAMRTRKSLRIYGEYASLSEDKKMYRSDKRAAVPYTSPTYPSYDLAIPDQARADAWLAEFQGFVAKGEMPALQIFHLPMDHTAGTRAGLPIPAACFADNDLALGRMVEAVSHSQFWKDTVFFVVEDDAQSGPDHVDSHRSVLMVISAYNRPQVYHRFVNTTDVLATIEQILGMGSLSQFDHYGSPLTEIFATEADMTPYDALTPKQSLTEKNPDDEKAQASLQLRLEKEDRSDDMVFNRILWAAIKGDIPYPGEHKLSLQQFQQEQ